MSASGPKMWCLGCGTAGNDPYSCAQKAKTKQLSGPLVKSGNFGANSLGRAGGGAKNGANQKTAEGAKGEREGEEFGNRLRFFSPTNKPSEKGP